jgi:hypothetical protein
MTVGSDEAAYLAANPDVAVAIQRGDFASGLHHLEAFGQGDGRALRPSPEAYQ